jgi:hypothetical protein
MKSRCVRSLAGLAWAYVYPSWSAAVQKRDDGRTLVFVWGHGGDAGDFWKSAAAFAVDSRCDVEVLWSDHGFVNCDIEPGHGDKPCEGLLLEASLETPTAVKVDRFRYRTSDYAGSGRPKLDSREFVSLDPQSVKVRRERAAAADAAEARKPPTIQALEVRPRTALVSPRATERFSATIVMSDDKRVDVTGKATWKSLSPEVVNVESSGLVTGVGTGVGQITATYEGQTDDASVSVSGDPKRLEPA